MPKLYFAYPGDLETPTGGYGYDRKIIEGLRALGWQIELLSLGEGYPFPSASTLSEAEARLAALPVDALLVVDGLAFGVLEEAAARLSSRLRLVALVHHPLCQENGLAEDRKEALFQSEQAALEHARHIIVTSPATAKQVHDFFDVAPERVTTVVPGTEKPSAYPRPQGDVIKLLSVGTVVPRKGYDLLFDALAGMANGGEPHWHLDIVGGLEADPLCYEALRQQALDLKLTGSVTFHGSVSRDGLEAFYRAANVFVLASRYEGYGMAYTEALAHGLPVIGSGGGAVRETLPQGAAIYCGTEDVAALRTALERLIFDAEQRHELETAARQAARALPDWSDAARLFGKALQEVTE